MGGILSFVRKPKKILILGLSGSGKTKILGQIANIYQLKPKINPSKHFNFLKCKGYNIWDLAAENNSFRFWPYYYDNTAGVIFAYDIENPHQSEALLREICSSKELRQAIILTVLNCSQIDTLSPEFHRIQRILKNRKSRFVPCSEETGYAELKQGFEWVIRNA